MKTKTVEIKTFANFDVMIGSELHKFVRWENAGALVVDHEGVECWVSVEYYRAQHSVHLTAFGVQSSVSNSLQMSLFADVPPAIIGGR